MLIRTPENISANFFMKGETPGHVSAPHIIPSQVHGKNILVVNASNVSDYALPLRPEADGILLTVPNVTASLRFADCAPVMICGDSWVMILHSGYKGTALNISGAGLRIAREIFADIGGARNGQKKGLRRFTVRITALTGREYILTLPGRL